jgi:hypothetical protein
MNEGEQNACYKRFIVHGRPGYHQRIERRCAVVDEESSEPWMKEPPEKSFKQSTIKESEATNGTKGFGDYYIMEVICKDPNLCNGDTDGRTFYRGPPDTRDPSKTSTSADDADGNSNVNVTKGAASTPRTQVDQLIMITFYTLHRFLALLG